MISLYNWLKIILEHIEVLPYKANNNVKLTLKSAIVILGFIKGEGIQYDRVFGRRRYYSR